jgi:hypothetical protein
MEFELDKGLAVLERTPRVVDVMLRGLGDAWVRSNEGGETWTPFDVVGHLVHADKTDWIPRARMILEHGERRKFEPFDRFAMLTTSAGRSLESLLDEFPSVRASSLLTVRGWKLTPERLKLRGTHPEFGSVTLGQLLATWVAHDLDHLSQIVRVMAKQYSSAVGPWAAFLKVVRS